MKLIYALQLNILLTVPRRYIFVDLYCISFCGSFMFFRLVFVMPVYASVYLCLMPAGKGLTSWLSFVVYNSEFVTFPLVSCVSLQSSVVFDCIYS